MGKKLCAVISVVLLISVILLTACNREGGERPVDERKSQLYIFNYDGGVGQQWINSAIATFEEKYKDYSFETGKTGVQVQVTKAKNETWRSSVLISRMPSLREEIFFTEEVFYYDYISSGALLDITDLVTDDLSEFGESGSIAEKLPKAQRDYYKTGDGKYYALPFYETYMGMYYDRDLFTEKKLYFAQNGGFITSASDTKSAGIDGVQGTYDDGLPVTYDDFFSLLEAMIDVGISVPVLWPGIAPEYQYILAAGMALDYEGYEKAMLNFTFDGMATVIDGGVSVDSNGYSTYTTKQQQITPGNACELAKQPGIVHALDFLNKLLKNNDYYSNNSFSSTYYHIDSQNDFISSKYESKKVGILIDGTYWENEAESVFDSLSNKPYSSKMERNFGFMPYPRPTADANKKQTYTSVFNSSCFINGNIKEEKKELAYTFFRFVHTDAQLADFTKVSSMPKPFEYEISDNMLSQMSTYGNTLWEARKAADIVYPNAQNVLYKTYGPDFALSRLLAASLGNPLRDVTPTDTFKHTNTSVADYFNAIYTKRLSLQSKYNNILG